jgi:hypothetical protein
MTRYRNSEQRRPAKDIAELFEVVGDPSHLPESFIEALARLLLENAEAKKSSGDTEQGSRYASASKSRSLDLGTRATGGKKKKKR